MLEHSVGSLHTCNIAESNLARVTTSFKTINYFFELYWFKQLFSVSFLIYNNKVTYIFKCRSQWPRGLRRGSATTRLLRLWVRIPPRAWMFFSCECCVLSGRCICVGLIIHPEESYWLWCVVVCDLGTSWMRSWPTWTVAPKERENIFKYWVMRSVDWLYRGFVLSCPGVLLLCRIESLHAPVYSVTIATLRTAIIWTHCILRSCDRAS
jgi:hypothetical protein